MPPRIHQPRSLRSPVVAAAVVRVSCVTSMTPAMDHPPQHAGPVHAPSTLRLRPGKRHAQYHSCFASRDCVPARRAARHHAPLRACGCVPMAPPRRRRVPMAPPRRWLFKSDLQTVYKFELHSLHYQECACADPRACARFSDSRT